jgi:hypothetical protein
MDAEARQTEEAGDKMLHGELYFFYFSIMRVYSFERVEDLNVEVARRQRQGQQRMACRTSATASAAADSKEAKVERSTRNSGETETRQIEAEKKSKAKRQREGKTKERKGKRIEKRNAKEGQTNNELVGVSSEFVEQSIRLL